MTNTIRRFARGQDCQIRIPGVCNHDPATTVLCHLPGGGMALKQPDLLAAFGCSSCHDAVDFRTDPFETRDQVRMYFYEGVFRTQRILLEAGIIKIQ